MIQMKSKFLNNNELKIYRNRSLRKSKMMNIVGRNNLSKPSNIGAGVGGTWITSIGK